MLICLCLNYICILPDGMWKHSLSLFVKKMCVTHLYMRYQTEVYAKFGLITSSEKKYAYVTQTMHM